MSEPRSSTPAQRSLFLSQLARVWREHPEFRLGQLLESVAAQGVCPLFYVDDQVLLKQLREWKP